jgi:hypothetical protein
MHAPVLDPGGGGAMFSMSNARPRGPRAFARARSSLRFVEDGIAAVSGEST